MEDVVTKMVDVVAMKEGNQHWSIIKMVFLEHQRLPHGEEENPQRFTGEDQDIEEDTPTDFARSTMGKFGKSLKSAFNRVTSTFMVRKNIQKQ